MNLQLIVIGLPLLFDGRTDHDQARLPQRLGERLLGQRTIKPSIAVLERDTGKCDGQMGFPYQFLRRERRVGGL